MLRTFSSSRVRPPHDSHFVGELRIKLNKMQMGGALGEYVRGRGWGCELRVEREGGGTQVVPGDGCGAVDDLKVLATTAVPATDRPPPPPPFFPGRQTIRALLVASSCRPSPSRRPRAKANERLVKTQQQLPPEGARTTCLCRRRRFSLPSSSPPSASYFT